MLSSRGDRAVPARNTLYWAPLGSVTATGSVPGPLGTRHPSITPFAAFAATDTHVIIAAGNDALFRTLCTSLERQELAEDPRFATNDLRTQHEAALREELESALRSRTAAEWLEVLQPAGVPCGPINDVEQVLSDPQVRARNMLMRVEDPEAGTLAMAGNPIKFSSHPDPAPRGPVWDPARERARATHLRSPSARCTRRFAALAGCLVIGCASPAGGGSTRPATGQ